MFRSRTWLGNVAFWWFVSGALLFPARGWAQAAPPPLTGATTQTIDEVRKDYPFHMGPLYLKPQLQLKEFGVDTNVFNQGDAPQSDFMATLTPQTQVAMTFGRRALLTSTLGTDLVYYQKFSSERSVDPQVGIRAEMYAKRLTLFAQNSYLNTRQRSNNEIDLRTRHLQNDVGGGVSVRLTPKVSVEVAGGIGKTRYKDRVYLGQNLKETLDRDTTGFSVTALDRLTPLTTVSVRYERLRDDFPFSPDRNTNSFSVVPGVTFKPRALIKGYAALGYRSFTPNSPLMPDYVGLVSRLNLSYSLFGSTTFGVSFDRDVAYSFEVSNPYYLDNSVGLFVRRQLTGRFDVILNATRNRADYRDLGLPTAVPPDERTDTTDTFGGNVGYRLKGQTRLGFGASYYKRDSTRVTFREYDGFRIGMTATYGF